MTPVATIVFATHNRRELLKRAIGAALAQTVSCSIVVADDASTDGTAEMLRTDFPGVMHLRSDRALGPVYQRNRGVEAAGTEFVVLLDDDAILESSRTVEQTLANFTRPDIGAVAMPFINILQDAVVRTAAPDREQIYLAHAFVAAAHAVRRSDFLAVGGYRECLYYMGEEGDLCLRLLAAGKVTRLGTADPVHHHQPPGRVSRWADLYGRRNDILVPVLTAPGLFLPWLLAGTTLKGLRFGLRVGRPARMAYGLAWGYASALREILGRRPVPQSAYRLFRMLKSREPVPIHEIDTTIHELRFPRSTA